MEEEQNLAYWLHVIQRFHQMLSVCQKDLNNMLDYVFCDLEKHPNVNPIFFLFQTVDRSVKDVYDLPINVTDDGMLVRLRNNLFERYQGPVISAQYTCRVRILGMLNFTFCSQIYLLTTLKNVVNEN